MITNKLWLIEVYLIQLRTLFTYRFEFWLNFFGRMIVHTLMGYFLWKAIFDYRQVNELNGYTLPVIILYYLLAPIIQGAIQGETIGFLSKEIYDGNLNKYIVYPINVTNFKLAGYLAYSSLYFAQLLIIIICYHFFYHPFYQGWTLATSLINGMVCLFLATLMYYFISLTIELMAFWFDQIWSIGVMIRLMVTFLSGVAIPIDFFPIWAQKLLYLTPFPYLINVPIKALMNQLSPQDLFKSLALQIFWIFIFSIIAKYLWHRGRYQYSGIGL